MNIFVKKYTFLLYISPTYIFLSISFYHIIDLYKNMKTIHWQLRISCVQRGQSLQQTESSFSSFPAANGARGTAVSSASESAARVYVCLCSSAQTFTATNMSKQKRGAMKNIAHLELANKAKIKKSDGERAQTSGTPLPQTSFHPHPQTPTQVTQSTAGASPTILSIRVAISKSSERMTLFFFYQHQIY